MRRAFDVTGENVVDGSALLQRRVERIDGCAWNTEGAYDAFLFQNSYGCIDCPHLRHVTLRSVGFRSLSITDRFRGLNARLFVSHDAAQGVKRARYQ